MYFNADANFQLNKQAQHQKGDPDDVPLWDGKAYFVNEAKFQSYIRDTDVQEEVRDILIEKIVLLIHLF